MVMKNKNRAVFGVSGTISSFQRYLCIVKVNKRSKTNEIYYHFSRKVAAYEFKITLLFQCVEMDTGEFGVAMFVTVGERPVTRSQGSACVPLGK